MKIKLHQIGDRPTQFEFQLTKSDLTRLEERIQFKTMDCKVQLTRNQEAILMHGFYSVEINAGCDLCLDPVQIDLNQQFDLVLVCEDAYDSPDGDVEISLQSDDVDFFDGQEIRLPDYFEDQLLLDLPFAIRCTENCQGICPECGVNRNRESCHCDEKSENTPFSVLGDL